MEAVDGYEELCLIGSGAMGEVRRCRNTATGQEVAVKSVRLGRLGQKAQVHALAEARILQALRHPCIVQAYAAVLEAGKLHLVLELADHDLGVAIKQQRALGRPFPHAQVWRMVSHIASAVDYVHAAGILHRDLKPENILLFGDGPHGFDLKLSDFGISKVLENTEHAQSVVGTPHYLSPEICTGEQYTTASDVWAFGVVLYEVACLRRPFEGDNIGAVALRIVREPPREMEADVPLSLQFLILGCLHKQAGRRMALSEVLRQEQVEVVAGQPLGPLALQGRPESAARSSRSAQQPTTLNSSDAWSVEHSQPSANSDGNRSTVGPLPGAMVVPEVAESPSASQLEELYDSLVVREEPAWSTGEDGDAVADGTAPDETALSWVEEVVLPEDLLPLDTRPPRSRTPADPPLARATAPAKLVPPPLEPARPGSPPTPGPPSGGPSPAARRRRLSHRSEESLEIPSRCSTAQSVSFAAAPEASPRGGSADAALEDLAATPATGHILRGALEGSAPRFDGLGSTQQLLRGVLREPPDQEQPPTPSRRRATEPAALPSELPPAEAVPVCLHPAGLPPDTPLTPLTPLLRPPRPTLQPGESPLKRSGSASTRASSSNRGVGSPAEPRSRASSERGAVSPIEAVSEALGLVERPEMPAEELRALMSSLGIPAGHPHGRKDERSPSFSSVSTLFAGRSLHVGDGRPHPHDVLPRRDLRVTPERAMRPATMPQRSLSFVGRLIAD